MELELPSPSKLPCSPTPQNFGVLKQGNIVSPGTGYKGNRKADILAAKLKIKSSV